MERIMTEFNKIMLSEKPSTGLSILEKTGLFDIILPEITALKGEEKKDKHKRQFLSYIGSCRQYFCKYRQSMAALGCVAS
jgi:tRNA nucleotidyltransferase/poly(A) polymerase